MAVAYCYCYYHYYYYYYYHYYYYYYYYHYYYYHYHYYYYYYHYYYYYYYYYYYHYDGCCSLQLLLQLLFVVALLRCNQGKQPLLNMREKGKCLPPFVKHGNRPRNESRPN